VCQSSREPFIWLILWCGNSFIEQALNFEELIEQALNVYITIIAEPYSAIGAMHTKL